MAATERMGPAVVSPDDVPKVSAKAAMVQRLIALMNAGAFEEAEVLRARPSDEIQNLREDFRDLFEEAPIAYVGRVLHLAEFIGGFAIASMLIAATASAQTSQSKFAEVNGVRLHYLVAGQGDAVVLLHGHAESSHMWLPLMMELAKTHTVIAPDLRGFGRSDKPADGYTASEHEARSCSRNASHKADDGPFPTAGSRRSIGRVRGCRPSR